MPIFGRGAQTAIGNCNTPATRRSERGRSKDSGQRSAFDTHYRCEVYLPGMQSMRLVLALEDDGLKVSVHPDFPRQQLAITIEPDHEGRHGFWVLGDHAKENARLSAQQLSEYLLKPVLSSAEINRAT